MGAGTRYHFTQISARAFDYSLWRGVVLFRTFSLMSDDLTTGVNIGISAIGIAISAFFAMKATRMASRTQIHASRQTATEWLRDLRQWADEAIEVLSTAIYQSTTNSGDTAEIQARLSALIDRGRFFLPNQRTSEYGLEKEYAYRGFRHSALDALAAAECVLRGEGTGRYRDVRLDLRSNKSSHPNGRTFTSRA